MAASVIRRLAKQYNVPIEDVERLWEASKQEALEYGSEDDPNFYATVVVILRGALRQLQKSRERR